MFLRLFLELRELGVPVSLREYLALLEGLDADLAGSTDRFYHLARVTLVKDERWFDRFDRAFASFMGETESAEGASNPDLPEEWLRRLAERYLTEEEKAQLSALGDWQTLMDTLKKRLQEQKERHQGGSRWIGTAGTSPFGAYGYNPEGVRIGQDRSRHRRAVKVWDRREFRNLDDTVELGTRNLKVALRRLRRFAREGESSELDLDDTIRATARNGGLLDLRLLPHQRNTTRILLLLDIGGSMDDHVELAERLFSAARSEFQHLESFYFHNCLYESVWRDNRRRRSDVIPTAELLRTYGPDYHVIVIGDASMSPYEIVQRGGAVEHWNEESGQVWLQRLLAQHRRAVWLNPVPESGWGYTHSIGMIRELFEDRMFPLTLRGLDDAVRELSGAR